MRHLLLVDDHPLIFDALVNRLATRDSLIRCSFAANGDDAEALIHKDPVDVLLMDITLGEESGFDLADQFRSQVGFTFFLTMHHSSSYLLRSYKEEYRGYFLKSDPLDLVIAAVSYPELKPFWAEETQMKTLESLSRNKEEPYESLSLREQEIFRLLAEGMTCKEIAYKLNISAKTASAHRYNILKKLKLKNQAEIVHYALDLGILM